MSKAWITELIQFWMALNACSEIKDWRHDICAGSSVGIILPATVSEAEREHFEMLLESLTNLLHRQVSELRSQLIVLNAGKVWLENKGLEITTLYHSLSWYALVKLVYTTPDSGVTYNIRSRLQQSDIMYEQLFLLSYSTKRTSTWSFVFMTLTDVEHSGRLHCGHVVICACIMY